MPVLLLLPVRLLLLLLLLHVRLHVGSDALLQPILKVHFLHRLGLCAQAHACRRRYAFRLLYKVDLSGTPAGTRAKSSPRTRRVPRPACTHTRVKWRTP